MAALTGGGVSSRTCIVLHPYRREASDDFGRSIDARLAEAVGLAEAIELDVVYAEAVHLPAVRPATLFGRGTVERLGEQIKSLTEAAGGQAPVAIVDRPITPVQQRNLERGWSCKVIDRTGLILEIFGERAKTREGELQVELASLVYQRSRLVRSWTHLERQRGGFGFMGGPGEAQIETDRRLITDRIAKLRRELADVRRTRTLHREARRRVPYPVVSLIGYTNAGKSTLFNRLTNADVAAQDQLFATLDPTMRGVTLPSGRRTILSDTVGFVSDLPHELVEAFRATLEEVISADILVHVRDIASPNTEAQKEDVLKVLRELGLGDDPEANVIEVLNKVDEASEDRLAALANRAERANRPVVLVSALTGEGCDALIEALDAWLGASMRVLDIEINPQDGATLAWLYRHGEVVSRHDDEAAIHLTVRLADAEAARYRRRQSRAATETGGS